MTITEALAEIKTVGKRIAKKQQFVLDYLYRQEQLKDPHAKDGGSGQMIMQTLQSIQDLEERVVELRRLIAEGNRLTTISMNGSQMPIADWLSWKREIAPRRGQFFNQMRDKIQQIRSEAARQGLATVAAEGAAKPGDVIVHLDEKWLADEIENHEETMGGLDGQLSLKNATTAV